MPVRLEFETADDTDDLTCIAAGGARMFLSAKRTCGNDTKNLGKTVTQWGIQASSLRPGDVLALAVAEWPDCWSITRGSTTSRGRHRGNRWLAQGEELMIRIILIGLGVVVVLVGAVVLTGALLPKRHVATRSVHLRLSPEKVWAFITDVDRYASWRPGVTKTERLPDAGGHLCWREYDRHGKMTYEVTESDAPSRWVTRIAQPGAPFGGTWTYVLASVADGGTTLTITEDGEVYNPVFRFVSRFVMGHTVTLDKYLTALGAALGETVPLRDA